MSTSLGTIAMERSGLAAGLNQDELAICERKLSEPCNFHGRDVETVGDLVKTLAEIEPTLSAEEYILEYRVVVVYLKDVLSEHTTAWIKLFDRLEKVVQDQEAWKEYRLIAAYKEEFGLIQTLRDYKVSNKRNADHARKLVSIFWPTYGRTLLHLRENVQGWARTLLTLANKERDKKLAMERLHRAVVDRLEKSQKYQQMTGKRSSNSIPIPTHGDAKAAIGLPRTPAHVREEELIKLGLYRQGDGLLDSSSKQSLPRASIISPSFPALPSLAPYTPHSTSSGPEPGPGRVVRPGRVPFSTEPNPSTENGELGGELLEGDERAELDRELLGEDEAESNCLRVTSSDFLYRSNNLEVHVPSENEWRVIMTSTTTLTFPESSALFLRTKDLLTWQFSRDSWVEQGLKTPFAMSLKLWPTTHQLRVANGGVFSTRSSSRSWPATLLPT